MGNLRIKIFCSVQIKSSSSIENGCSQGSHLHFDILHMYLVQQIYIPSFSAHSLLNSKKLQMQCWAEEEIESGTWDRPIAFSADRALVKFLLYYTSKKCLVSNKYIFQFEI